MALKRKPYFSDDQIKRYIIQLLSVFSGFQVQTGNQRDGRKHFIDVPVMYGDSSRTVGYIISGSENSMAALPIMSLYVTGLDPADEYRHAPQLVEKVRYIERKRDADGNLLINKPGEKKTLERYSPTCYIMTFDLAIWSSNNHQQYQLLEQLLVYTNSDGGTFEIQLSNSPQDWISMSYVFYKGMKFEKAIPAGTDPDPLYVATLSFETIFWLSVPVKVYDQKIIKKIIIDIKDIDNGFDIESGPLLTQFEITPDLNDPLNSLLMDT